MAVAMPEIKTGGPSVGLVEKKEVSFETNIRPEDKVRTFRSSMISSLRTKHPFPRSRGSDRVCVWKVARSGVRWTGG